MSALTKNLRIVCDAAKLESSRRIVEARKYRDRNKERDARRLENEAEEIEQAIVQLMGERNEPAITP
jgi:hypothetical protein